MPTRIARYLFLFSCLAIAGLALACYGRLPPEAHSPWRGSQMNIQVEIRDLHPNYIPSWTSDGKRIIFAVGRGFHYDEPPPGASTPEREIYLNQKPKMYIFTCRSQVGSTRVAFLQSG